LHEAKPKFGRFETWGACSRCGARVKYSTLARERLTGLLVCTSTSGRPVRPCLDPWPPVYDFQVTIDRSIEPPPEPLPARWMLDDIFSASTYNPVSKGTPGAYANAPKAAPDDSARLQALLIPPTGTYSSGVADFLTYQSSMNQHQKRTTLEVINPFNYDGTFVPSNTVRTVTPPDANAELTNLQADSGWSPPWAVRKGV
jgi:hypothetical protein